MREQDRPERRDPIEQAPGEHDHDESPPERPIDLDSTDRGRDWIRQPKREEER